MFKLPILRTMISMPRMVSIYLKQFINHFVYLSFLSFDIWIKTHTTEHFNPLFEQITKLEEALYNIQFEQHWLEAETDRQAVGIIPKTSFYMTFHLIFTFFDLKSQILYRIALINLFIFTCYSKFESSK